LPTWHLIATVGPNITSYSDTGLDCYTLYPYRVRAYNANGKSLYSNESQAVTFTADTFETDNTYATASTIVVNGALQVHNFHAANDEDWSKFSANAGQTYTITTSYLGSANDTFLELYDKNGATQLEWNDDCGGPASCIQKWVAPSSGTYYVRVHNYYDEGGCPGYQYSLKVITSPVIASLAPPSVTWPNTSVLGIQWTWVDPNIGIAHAFEVQRRVWITPTLGLWRQVGISGPGIMTLARPSDGNFIFDDTNLTCNTTYEYRIRAFDELGASAYSEVISATTLLIDTFEPDDDYTQAQTIFVNSPYIQAHNLAPAMDYDWVSFTATAGEVYTVTTSQFTHSDSYTPTLALYGDPTAIPLASTQQCGADLRAFCLNGWTAPTSGAYYIRVSGQGGCPGHDYTLTVVDSNVSSLWPAAPTGLVATLTTSNQINLAWTDNTAYDHDGFRLDRLVGLGWMRVANLIGFTSYSDVGVSCGQSYTYRVYAYNTVGKSDYATLTISTPGCGYPVIYLPVLMIQ
jgi:titin